MPVPVLNTIVRRSTNALFVAALVVSCALCLPTPAVAGNITLAGSMEGNLAISPGDTVRAGYALAMPASHGAANITVKGALAQMQVSCPDGSAQTLTIKMPDQSFSIGINDNAWYPTADQGNAAGYEGTTTAPANLCGGQQGHAPNGATFTANFKSSDTTDPVNVRFHYSDNSPGAWSATTAIVPPKAAPASSTPVFGREVIVDHQRITGEPSIAIDGLDRIYVSAPWGFSTTASFLWRSEDHGQSFHLVPGNDPTLFGKPLSCVGGGDTALAIDSLNRVYFSDLQGLTDVSGSVSSDQGATWLSTCNESNNPAVDRPWIATIGDPQNGGAMYQTVDQVGQCTDECSTGQIGSNLVEITRSQDGVTFTPLPAQPIEPDNIVSGIVTDPNTGAVYIAHTGLADATGKLAGAGDGNTNSNAIYVVVFPRGYNATTAIPLTPGMTLCQMRPDICTTSTVVFVPPDAATGNATVNIGQDFAPIAIDRQGNLYVVWAQSDVSPSTGLIIGPTQVFLSVSTDRGLRWSAPVNVSASAPSLKTNVFAWVAAGDAGRVDIVWYGTPTLGNCPAAPCGAGFINAHWNVMMAQSLNTIVNGRANPTPTFTTTQVSEVSNHFGQICEFGIACTTGGDRGLIDFLSVTVGKQGEANVVWADAVNRNFVGGTSSALIAFNRQVSGPSLYADIGQVNGSAALSGSAPGSPEAFYSALGSATLATGNLLIQAASVTMPDPLTYQFTINIADGATLAVPPTLGGTDAVWMVRWQVPDANGAGHSYFAAMESDLGQQPTFFDGETLTFNTTKGKMMTYNPAHSIKGSFTKSSSGGVITLWVPVADVGGAAVPLYSVTAVTATQSMPSGSGNLTTGVTATSTGPIFNQINASAPFDFKP